MREECWPVITGEMSLARRIGIVALILLAGVVSIALSLNVFVGKWNESARSGISRAYGTSQGKSAKFQPEGDRSVTLDVPGFLEGVLKQALSRELSRITLDSCIVRFAGDDDGGGAFENSVYVTLSASGVWTPFWGTYNDAWEFEFSDSGSPVTGLSDTFVIEGQELYAKGECTNGGTGIGIVGRRALTARGL
jgi:hypothetical protein